jgi:hypothetical protein
MYTLDAKTVAIISVVDGDWQTVVESQNSAIPAAAMWHCHIRVWREILQYRPKLAMAESQKNATDSRDGQYLMTLQHMHISYVSSVVVVVVVVMMMKLCFFFNIMKLS